MKFGIHNTFSACGCDEQDPPRDAGHLGGVSQPRAPRKDRGKRGYHQPRPADLRHRRRLAHPRVSTIQLGIPREARRPHRANGRGDPDRAQDVERTARDLPREVFSNQRSDPRTEVGAETASARDDRRQRRAIDSTRRRALGRCLQSLRRCRDDQNKIRCAALNRMTHLGMPQSRKWHNFESFPADCAYFLIYAPTPNHTIRNITTNFHSIWAIFYGFCKFFSKVGFSILGDKITSIQLARTFKARMRIS